MSLGSNIKKRRFELNLSQQELANLMGYKSRSTIAKIESGENDVTQAKIRKFASVLDTTFEALISSVSENSGISGTAPNTINTFSPILGVQPIVSSSEISNRNKNAVIILAGGKSVRNHQNIPNQFINILGKPIIVYCLEAYQNHPSIDDIYIVCLKGWEDIVKAYAEQYHITKLRGLIPGGASGIVSVMNAVDSIKDNYNDSDVVIFQESTRPMISVDMISKLLQASSVNGTATICQSMKDYVQFTYSEKKANYVDRDTLVDLQSPEAHKLSRIKAVFEKAKKKQDPLTESCCTMLMYKLGFDINFIEGSVNNIKIVRQEDIVVVTTLLKQMK